MSSGAGGPVTAGSIASQAGLGTPGSPYTGLPDQQPIDNPFIHPPTPQPDDSPDNFRSTTDMFRRSRFGSDGPMGGGGGASPYY